LCIWYKVEESEAVLKVQFPHLVLLNTLFLSSKERGLDLGWREWSLKMRKERKNFCSNEGNNNRQTPDLGRDIDEVKVLFGQVSDA